MNRETGHESPARRLMEPVPAPLVGVVIVGYGDPDSVRACLESLRAGTCARYRILLVDNSPSDVLARAFAADPDVEYLPTGDNLGFTRGCNAGIARARELGADYVLLLNPDTVLEADCLEHLVRAARDRPDAGIVGGRIHYLADPEKTWYAGGRLNHLTGVGAHLDLKVPAAVETTYVTGCCMLVPCDLLARIGGLEERIFMYLDDAEFCLRVRRAGKRLYYEPRARLGHKVGPGPDWRLYPDYYLYFSVRNRPLVAHHAAYRAHLHLAALAIAATKAVRYALAPGVPSRGRKLRALAWGAVDSLSGAARERRRFPELFRPRPGERAVSSHTPGSHDARGAQSGMS